MTDSASNKTILFRSPLFAGHDTGDHPEHPDRYLAIEQELLNRGTLANRPELLFAAASDEAILRVHSPAHLRSLESITARGGAWITPDTLVAPDSLDAARHAASAAIAGVDAVLDGITRRAFALGRPPGHHATRDQAMGFCLLNSIAIAAAHARHRGLRRVAIIDWDVHHGNGTQDIFYRDGTVLYCSMHQSPWYPYTGDASETGAGEGIGTTCNIPLPAGSGDSVWLDVLDGQFAPLLTRFQPDLILLSAGFDAHRDDPLGAIRLTDKGYTALGESVVELANTLCQGRIVAVLEGGYNTAALARNVVNLIETLDT
jgi:acetoin utilization deacetylase AcuC-like enzyme